MKKNSKYLLRYGEKQTQYSAKLNIYIFLIAKLYLLPLTTVNYSFFIHYHANTELFLITSNIKTLKLFSFISVFFI